MRTWTYTDDIHDWIIVGNEKFQLNTAYDNIFRLFKYMDNGEDKVETFMRIMFYYKDSPRIKKVTENWTLVDYTSLINYIVKEFISDNVKETNKRKITDIYKDAELIFASFYFDYGISLIEKKGKMTWKEFLILYTNLSSKSPLGKAMELCNTDGKDLTADGKRMKFERLAMLNENIDLNGQLDGLASFLKTTAKKR